jgi:ABC-type transport system involved in cytochrome c biogenesis ATPase subunit
MMIDTHPPAQRLRIAAQQLDAGLDAGQFARLASMQLVGLRGLVWMMDETAEQLDAAEMIARPVRARAGWLARWFS